MISVTKTFRDFPAAHRQPNHDGHCRRIHGHNWSFDITFTCAKPDACGFVVDVGRLDKVKEFLTKNFDHTLLLNTTDPYLTVLAEFLEGPDGFDAKSSFAEIILVQNCGMEGLAEYVCYEVDLLLLKHFPECYKERTLRVESVVCWEDSKNSATFLFPHRTSNE